VHIELSGSYSLTVMVIGIGSRGLLYSSRGTAAILSTTSMPRITSPKMLYLRSNPLLSARQIKNCEPLSLKSRVLDQSLGVFAIEMAPRLCGRSLSSGFSQ
jgi:hypothetical protein